MKITQCSLQKMITIPSSRILSALLERFQKYVKCSDVVHIYTVILMDKFITNGQLDITAIDVPKLLLVCLVVAVKFLEDKPGKNSFYAEVGGVSREELNKLEVYLLKNLLFNVNVEQKVLQNYYDQMKIHVLHCPCCAN